MIVVPSESIQAIIFQYSTISSFLCCELSKVCEETELCLAKSSLLCIHNNMAGPSEDNEDRVRLWITSFVLDNVEDTVVAGMSADTTKLRKENAEKSSLPFRVGDQSESESLLHALLPARLFDIVHMQSVPVHHADSCIVSEIRAGLLVRKILFSRCKV